MKTINVRNLQHHLRAILDEVAQGETVEITRRNETVAKLIPPREKKSPEPWPDMRRRLESIYGRKRIVPTASEAIYKDRN